MVEFVDTDSLRVHPPAAVMFVCGGPENVKVLHPLSLRDAFMKTIYDRSDFPKYEVILAEKLNGFFPRGNYQDWMSFEADIAQISELILLFCESFGSAVELGAFCMIPDVAQKLLIIIDDEHYADDSFVVLGPIRSQTNTYGEASVSVLHRSDVGIKSIADVSGIDLKVFGDRVLGSITERRRAPIEHTTFNKSRNGHLIKLMVGLLQHYGALTSEEISVHLDSFGCPLSVVAIEDLLLCAIFAQWVAKEKRGVFNFYAALPGNEALQYKMKRGVAVVDKKRWVADVREHWKKLQPERHQAIQAAMSGAAR